MIWIIAAIGALAVLMIVAGLFWEMPDTAKVDPDA